MANHGGDRNSARQTPDADIQSVAEAREYAAYLSLRGQLLASMKIAEDSFRTNNANDQGPYNVLDKTLRRNPQGTWTKGPVDAFKARCSATLFAIVADQGGDSELCG